VSEPVVSTMEIRVVEGMVLVRHAQVGTIVLPAEGARQIAHALLQSADQCDGRRSFLFMHGPPERRMPEGGGRRT
jgi:hypothetical protein